MIYIFMQSPNAVCKGLARRSRQKRAVFSTFSEHFSAQKRTKRRRARGFRADTFCRSRSDAGKWGRQVMLVHFRGGSSWKMRHAVRSAVSSLQIRRAGDALVTFADGRDRLTRMRACARSIRPALLVPQAAQTADRAAARIFSSWRGCPSLRPLRPTAFSNSSCRKLLRFRADGGELGQLEVADRTAAIIFQLELPRFWALGGGSGRAIFGKKRAGPKKSPVGILA